MTNAKLRPRMTLDDLAVLLWGFNLGAVVSLILHMM